MFNINEVKLRVEGLENRSASIVRYKISRLTIILDNYEKIFEKMRSEFSSLGDEESTKNIEVRLLEIEKLFKKAEVSSEEGRFVSKEIYNIRRMGLNPSKKTCPCSEYPRGCYGEYKMREDGVCIRDFC